MTKIVKEDAIIFDGNVLTVALFDITPPNFDDRKYRIDILAYNKEVIKKERREVVLSSSAVKMLNINESDLYDYLIQFRKNLPKKISVKHHGIFKYSDWDRNYKIYRIGKLIEAFFNCDPSDVLEPDYLRNSIEIEFYEIITILEFYKSNGVLKAYEYDSDAVIAQSNWWQRLNAILEKYKPVHRENIFSRSFNNIKKHSIRYFIAVLAIITAPLIVDYFEKPDESYKQIQVDFNNWLEDYDIKLVTDFDLLLTDFATRGVFNSGEAVANSIEYFKEFRRERDNKIESFLVAYSIAGGDTLNLSYTRKLPINVHNIIKSRWPNNFFKLERYKLDTI